MIKGTRILTTALRNERKPHSPPKGLSDSVSRTSICSRFHKYLALYILFDATRVLWYTNKKYCVKRRGAYINEGKRNCREIQY